MIAAVTWVKALKTERCFGSLSEENSLMWPMIVGDVASIEQGFVEERNWQGFHVGATRVMRMSPRCRSSCASFWPI